MLRESRTGKNSSFAGAESARQVRPKDDGVLREEQIKKLKLKIGEMVMDSTFSGRQLSATR